MADLTQAAATAKRLVEANGRVVTLLKTNRTADDLARPWEGSTASESALLDGDSQTATVCFVPPSGGGFGRKFSDAVDPAQVALDQIGLLAADSVPGVSIEDFDRLLDSDGRVWKIVTREALRPASGFILYALGLVG